VLEECMHRDSPRSLVATHRGTDDRMTVNEAGAMIDRGGVRGYYRSPTICPPPRSPSVEYRRLSWPQTAMGGAMP
jgi:hypothetical protein